MDFRFGRHLRGNDVTMKSNSRFYWILALLIGSMLMATQHFYFSGRWNGLMNHPLMGPLLQRWEFYSTQSMGERIYIQLDKPIAEPGDDIWFTAYLRKDSDLSTSHFSDIVYADLINPQGVKEKSIRLIAKKGIANGDFKLAEEAPGGLYKIKVWTSYQENDSSFVEKTIQVQDVIMPEVMIQGVFSKSSFNPGESGTYAFEMKDQQLKNIQTKLTCELRIDSKIVSSKTIQTEAQKTELPISIPSDLSSEDVLLTLSWNRFGQADSYTRRVPVSVKKVSMRFYPEGGDLIYGVPCHLAFKAFSASGAFQDVSGIVLINNKEVGQFHSIHQGRGYFPITIKEGDRMEVEIQKPTVQRIPVEVSSAVGGFAMHCKVHHENISVSVFSTLRDSVFAVLSCRNQLQWTKSYQIVAGENHFNIPTAMLPIGIHQLTLVDSKGIARSERLMFVNKHKKISIEIKTDKESYQPREKVTVQVQVKDERGLPVPASLGVSVVKESIFKEISEHPSHLLSSLLLEQELTCSLEKPGFYFDPQETKADEALNALLLTEGWRRFTWEQITEGEVKKFVQAPEKAIITGIVMNGNTNQPAVGALLSIDGKKIAVTDAQGHYQLSGIELYQPILMKIEQSGLGYSSIHISEYGEQTMTYLFGMHRRHLEMAPMGGVQDELMKMDQAERNIVVQAPLVPMKNAEVRMNKKNNMGLAVKSKAEIKPVAMAPKMRAIAADTIIEFEPRILREYEDIKNPENTPYYRARVFEIKKPAPLSESDRRDFRNTIFWSGGILVDRTGKYTTQFYNSDEVASYRIYIEGISHDGLPGSAVKNYTTTLPLSVQFQAPSECTQGDHLSLPVLIRNNTASALPCEVTMSLPSNWTSPQATMQVSVNANESKTIYWNMKANNPGSDSIRVQIQTNQFSDVVKQKLNVLARGYPMEVQVAGKELRQEFRFDINNVVPGSMYTSYHAYPNVMNDLMSGVESILREPYGCFEQTSTSNYPNVMAKKYLKESGQSFEKEKYLDDLLDRGYKRLTSFETKTKGYEWFGQSPAHEGLTAYGLMQFQDMKEIYPGVDERMIERTAKWLLSRKNGQGGFMRSEQALDQFGRASEEVTDAYIVFALSEAGFHQDIEKEISVSEERSLRKKDSYLLALNAIALFNAGQIQRSAKLVEVLKNQQAEDGSWKLADHSITRSGGKSLEIETSALAILALLPHRLHQASVDKGIKFLISNRSGFGGFGSTQATVLALKALTSYASVMKTTKEAGQINIRINKQLAGKKIYQAGEKEILSISGMEKFLKEGENLVQLTFEETREALPYAMTIGWNTTQPSSDKECQVILSSRLSKHTAKLSELVRLECTVQNTSTQGLPMTMACIGIPAGLQIQAWQIKELQDKQVIDFYELRGNRLVVYYRQMKPSEIRSFQLDLKACMPGSFEGQASYAYLYYTAEFKNWNTPLKIEIQENSLPKK